MPVKYLKYIIVSILVAGTGFALWPVLGEAPSPPRQAAVPAATPASVQLPDLVHALAKANVQPIEPVAVPDFSLPDVKRQKVRFSDFAGKVVMVNFWTTY